VDKVEEVEKYMDENVDQEIVQVDE